MSVTVREPEAIMQAVKGFTEETVRALSAARQEPEWMLAFRLAAWQQFEAMPWPTSTDEDWRRTRLTGFNLAKFKPFAVSSGRKPKAELASLIQDELAEMDSSASMVFEDGSLRFSQANVDLGQSGIIFTDLESAVREHPALVQQYS